MDIIGNLCVVICVIALWFWIFRYTFVEEGTAKVITFWGSFQGVILNWWGYRLGNDYGVIPGPNIHFLPGGLRFVGLRLFTKIDSTVSVQPVTTEIQLKNEETEPSERIPLDILFQILYQIVNPWKKRFRSPPNLIEVIRNALEALLRGWVSMRKYDWVVDCKQSPQAIWEGSPAVINDPNDSSKNRPALPGLKDDPVIRGFEEEYGVRILPAGIQLMDVGFTPEYQGLIALKEKKRLEAEALAKKVETLVESRMAKARTKGDVVAFKASLVGNDPLKLRYEEKCEELTDSLLAYEAGARTVISGDGISATLDSLVDKVVKAFLQGKSGPS